MPKMKSILNVFAKTCRFTAFGLENWYWLLLAICIVSPISPHIRVPYAVSYSDCAYVGTRGMMQPVSSNCPIVAIINTRDGEIASW